MFPGDEQLVLVFEDTGRRAAARCCRAPRARRGAARALAGPGNVAVTEEKTPLTRRAFYGITESLIYLPPPDRHRPGEVIQECDDPQWTLALSRIYGIFCLLSSCCSLARPISPSWRQRLHPRAASGSKPPLTTATAAPSQALYVLDHFDQAITTLLIGTNILHLTIATLVTVAVQRAVGHVGRHRRRRSSRPWSCSSQARCCRRASPRNTPSGWPCATARSLRFFMVLFQPLSALLTAFGNAVARRVHERARRDCDGG